MGLKLKKLLFTFFLLNNLKFIDLYCCKIKFPDPLPDNPKDIVEYLRLKKEDKNEKVP